MENLTSKIAEKIKSELDLDNEQKEIIAYGVFGLFQIMISIVFVVVFGLIFHVATESLIISFTSAILRKYSGGVHASTPSGCLIIGTIISVGQALLITLLKDKINNLQIIIIIGVIIFILAYYLVLKLAPVDSTKKPIKSEIKRNRMKKKSIQIVSFYLIIVIMLILLFISSRLGNAFLYLFCIYMGILSQVFTLTTIGHKIMAKVDAFFISLLIFGKGGRVE